MANTCAYDLVVGLGRSGVSMARFLKFLGRDVMATDIDRSRTAEATALESLGITTRIGSHDQQDFNRAQRIIPSPGIPLTVPCIRNAAAKGVPVTGELDIFYAYNTTPVIAVTGSNGKTTTTRLIAQMAQHSGLACFVGGNIGTPLVEYLMSGDRADLVVAEISSFQLDLAGKFAPHTGVLLNISRDHLDRYPDYKAYRDSKWSLFARQDENGTAVINAGIQNFDKRTIGLNARIEKFLPQKAAASTDLTVTFRGNRINIAERTFKALPGGHNRENITAAALAVLASGGTFEGVCNGLEHFDPLPHRTAFAGDIKGVRFYNDSKATNTDAVVRALEAFDDRVILIAGGREKDTDFNELIPALTGVKGIMAIGEAKHNINKTLGAVSPVTLCDDMAQAVRRGYDSAGPGDIVLLSPACASFDMYKNYEDRGTDFIRQVNRLKREIKHG